MVYDTLCFRESGYSLDSNGLPKAVQYVSDDNLEGFRAYIQVGNVAIDECDGDEDCMKRGTQWSAIFAVGGVLYLCLTINMIFVGIGAWKAWARFIGACCACPMWCFNFAMIIVTATFR